MVLQTTMSSQRGPLLKMVDIHRKIAKSSVHPLPTRTPNSPSWWNLPTSVVKFPPSRWDLLHDPQVTEMVSKWLFSRSGTLPIRLAELPMGFVSVMPHTSVATGLLVSSYVSWEVYDDWWLMKTTHMNLYNIYTICIYIYIHTYVYICMHTNTHTHTYIYIYLHMYTHVLIHIAFMQCMMVRR